MSMESQPESKGVNLDRNIPFESGIEYNVDHYYRMIGEEGFDDFIDTGLIQAAQDTKQEYEKSYFFKGQPLQRYASQKSRVQYFVEVKPGENLFSVTNGSYPFSVRPITVSDEVRIYKFSPSDGAEMVFDSFKQDSK